MLRDYSIEMINKLSKAGAATKDAEIVQWVNNKVVFLCVFASFHEFIFHDFILLFFLIYKTAAQILNQ